MSQAPAVAEPAPLPQTGVLAEPPASRLSGGLRVDDVSLAYGRRTIVKRASFEIEAGRVCALLGANGAGKSTLLKACLGLQPVASGSIRLLDRDVTTMSEGARRSLRSRCGFVAQKHNLVARTCVLSNVLHGLLGHHGGPMRWMHAFARNTERDRAMASLQRVGLAHLANRRVDTLSGGQAQRVAVARAIVSEPSVIFADEPVASLDPGAGEDVMRLLVDLACEHGTTVLFTTHAIEHALRFGDRLLALSEGAIAIDTNGGEVSEAALRRLYA